MVHILPRVPRRVQYHVYDSIFPPPRPPNGLVSLPLLFYSMGLPYIYDVHTEEEEGVEQGVNAENWPGLFHDSDVSSLAKQLNMHI